MPPTPEQIARTLAERVCWQAARREDSQVAERLSRQQLVDGMYRLDEGALLDEFVHFLQPLGVVDWRDDVPGTAIPRVWVPCGP